MINHKDSITRIKAIKELVERNVPNITRDIGRVAVTDNSVEVRKCAVKALGIVGEENATEYLIRALYDPSSWVRAVAAKSLGMKGDRGVLKHLKRSILHDTESVKRCAAESILKLGDSNLIDAVLPDIDPSEYRFEEEVFQCLVEEL